MSASVNRREPYRHGSLTRTMATSDLDFAPLRDPVLSVAVLLTRGLNLAEPCLRSIARARAAAPPSEVVLLLASDDAGTRSFVRERVRGATVLDAPPGLNVGLGPAQNLMFANARGRWMILLHEDSQPSPGAFQALVATATAERRAAVIGAQMVDAGGELRQAGAVVWSDARVSAVVGDSATARTAPYAVDACGMAGTLVDRSAWRAIGGFDERFFPAFYGDTDFCLAAWRSGRSVLCEPRAIIRHDGEAALDPSADPSRSSGMRAFLVERHRSRFAEKWRDALAVFAPLDPARAPEPTELELAVERSGACRAAAAGLLGAEQERPITRPGDRDADRIDAAVEAGLRKAQAELLRDYSERA
jgi:GT2 family glycosyltransferase